MHPQLLRVAPVTALNTHTSLTHTHTHTHTPFTAQSSFSFVKFACGLPAHVLYLCMLCSHRSGWVPECQIHTDNLTNLCYSYCYPYLHSLGCVFILLSLVLGRVKRFRIITWKFLQYTVLVKGCMDIEIATRYCNCKLTYL